ncbi:uncharacterized protein LOC141822814 [Curcuma longa]|uniref:uncharacterized protein LOC141822814 n=1 Tax=Curcuma longa TaxID=136217 RepID=UPI003D9EF5B0
MLQHDHAELEWYKHLEEKKRKRGGGAPGVWKWKGEASVRGGSEAGGRRRSLLRCDLVCLMLLVADGIKARIGWNDGSSPSSFTKAAGDADKLLGGLLSGEFDEASCLSRYQAASYWKNPSLPPPPHRTWWPTSGATKLFINVVAPAASCSRRPSAT